MAWRCGSLAARSLGRALFGTDDGRAHAGALHESVAHGYADKGTNRISSAV